MTPSLSLLIERLLTLRAAARGTGLLVLLALTACGGASGAGTGNRVSGSGLSSSSSSSSASSSSSSSSSSSTSSGGDGWVAGAYPPSSQYAQKCQSPPAGSGDAQGSTLDENFWLRSWTHELYLWYGEVTDVDPGTVSTTAAYFQLMMTTATTSTGQPKDRFHFTYPTTQWQQLSQSGVDVGYGLTWDIAAGSPPRQVYVAYVWPGNAAASAGVVRGMTVLSVDGVDMVNADDSASVNTLNAGLSPSNAGEAHTFVLQQPNSTATTTVTLTAADVTENPVPLVKTISPSVGPAGPIGYILFNDHIATSEQDLINAVNTLKAAGIKDLVLDIRYNGGGYLAIASELAYMIAGPSRTNGQTFDQITFNTQYAAGVDPVTGQADTRTPFYSTPQISGSSSVMPNLGLSRVFVLTGPETCSASEAIMNGLNGVGVQVIQIGSTTCGKPYGFYPQDNCGTTYFSIQFQSENAQGFSNYGDGFSPSNSTTLTSAVLPGCSVADDFNHALGDPAEGRLAAAVNYRASPSCPTASGLAPVRTVDQHATVHRQPWRENRILLNR